MGEHPTLMRPSMSRQSQYTQTQETREEGRKSRTVVVVLAANLLGRAAGENQSVCIRIEAVLNSASTHQLAPDPAPIREIGEQFEAT